MKSMFTVITLALIIALILASPVVLLFEQTIPATYSRTITWR